MVKFVCIMLLLMDCLVVSDGVFLVLRASKLQIHYFCLMVPLHHDIIRIFNGETLFPRLFLEPILAFALGEGKGILT